MLKKLLLSTLLVLFLISCGGSYSILKKEKPEWINVLFDSKVIIFKDLDENFRVKKIRSIFDLADLRERLEIAYLEPQENQKGFDFRFGIGFERDFNRRFSSPSQELDWVYENGKIILSPYYHKDFLLMIEDIKKMDNELYRISIRVDGSTENSFFYRKNSNETKVVHYNLMSAKKIDQYLVFLVNKRINEQFKKIQEEKQARKAKNEPIYLELAKKYKLTGNKFGDGWQNLKWGMSIEKIEDILINEGYKKSEAHEQDFAEQLKKIQEQQQKKLNPDKATFYEKELVMKKGNLQVTCYFVELLPDYFALYQVGLVFDESRMTLVDIASGKGEVQYLNKEFYEKLVQKYGEAKEIGSRNETTYEPKYGGSHLFQIKSYQWDDGTTSIELAVSEMIKGQLHISGKFDPAIYYTCNSLWEEVQQMKKKANEPKNSDSL